MSTGAVVTGAAQGLGKAIAAALHRAGFSVAVTDVRADAAEEAAREIAPTGERITAFGLDVLKKEDFATGLARAAEAFGRVDVLVNNAAMTPTTPLMEITPEEFDRVTAVNQRGTFFGCQVFGAHFALQGYGRIVNMASLAGQNGGTASGAHYAASKGAILTLTKIFARQLASSGVTVNAVAPGPMDLPSVREIVPPEKLAQIIDTMIPVKALGDPDFVADIVVRLAGRDAGFVTGAAWDLNGGIFMR
ncbi:SDR family NAD(P)-dependent oxidoreductase [Azospirillum rugosum]|uniref:3-oxoacyl-[acyl-carrier protein] reductase n=1 Tax=Azospirillum rugosum TaxID=416170 RepID=A0ABS4SMZ1_9PROT|nr:SDR family oxidoreductase [Azospirillum rugosum]MBP2292750.1 3-oxoacyl-[acyl-carrier protein] reductase [Azospirillum rugosum]MDQ0527009.1 3-oxoacyl-[acyl-carrier protein] reductase [Azospirillum rugosum]